ncbi:Fc.00g094980.m01.CDS01 [Cosmosporella sp. VM-42]
MKGLCLALLTASAQAAATLKQFTLDSADTPHAGYIIELEPGAANSKRDTHSLFHKRAEELAADYSVKHEFTNSDYFYGLSIDATKEDAATLAALPEVKNIWPNRVHSRPSAYISTPRSTTGVQSSRVSIRADNVTVAHVTGDSDIHSSLKMADVDKVHKLGITGKGVKVAVIDSGIDYRHPALGGGFGEGFKVAGGYDLVGEDYTGFNTPVPDSDPLTTCLEGGHGTHVAGTIAARDPKGVGFGVLGVAPDASIYAYRIFSCEGSAADDIIMQSFEKAAGDGVDVISMSAGYTNIWETDSPYAPLMQGLLDKGVGLVIAAGNDGGRGPYFASAPALVPAVIAVGSVANDVFTNIYHANDSTGQMIEYSRIVPVEDAENEFHVFTVPNEDSSCTLESWTNASKDFSDKKHLIALLSAGSTCQYMTKLNEFTNATGITEIWLEAYAGADLRLEEPGWWPGYNVLQIDPAQGKKMRAGLAAQGANYTLTFKDQEVHDTPQWDGGSMNFFSTYGPTMEMSLKPQIAAPGGNILNVWPVTDGLGYAIISGTSMATPFLSGVYALIKASDPSLTPEEIRIRLQNSAVPMIEAGQTDLLSTTAHQGAGLVNALNGINYAKTKVTPSELNLRDSSKPKAQTITIENRSKTSKTYTLGHKGAGMIDALPQILAANTNNQFRWAADYTASYATAKFSKATVKVAAGSKATVEVTITPPTDFVVDKLPVYAGYITLKSGEEKIVVPYAGVPYSRNAFPVLDTTNVTALDFITPGPPEGIPVVPSLSSNDQNIRNNDIDTYTFVDGNFPGVFLSVRQPSANVRVDLVPVDTKFEPTYYGYDTSIKHSNFTRPPLDLESLDNIFNVSSYGATAISYGIPSVPRAGELGRLWRGYGAYRMYWDTPIVGLNNGTTYELPNGDYRFLLRVLKWGKDWQKSESYESWLSPIASIKRA